MNHSLNVPKASFMKQNQPRTPSITFKTEELNPLSMTANIDLSKFLKGDETKKNKWLNHLHDKPLLELITDKLPEKQCVPVNQTELNCYERLKKLLSLQTGKNYDEKQSEQHEHMLEDVAILEDRLNKLESKFKENSAKKNKSSKYIRAYLHTPSSHQKQKPSLNQSMTLLLRKNTGELKKTSSKLNERKTAYTFSKQHVLEFKQACVKKFLTHSKGLDEKVYAQIQEYIESKIKLKIQEIFNIKNNEAMTCKEENQGLKNSLLEKELEIEALRKELKHKEEKNNSSKVAEPVPETGIVRRQVILFHEEYQRLFGDITLAQLKTKLDQMEYMYFHKYANTEAKHLQLYHTLTQQKQQLQRQQKEQVARHAKEQQELNQIITQIRKHQQLDNSYETHELFSKISYYKQQEQQLKQLQQFILNKYVQWTEHNNSQQHKVADLLEGKSPEHYQQMIENMLEFNQYFRNPEKQIQFTTKLLTAIQKLKKIINPAKCFQKLEPLRVLEQVQTILKNPKRRRERKLRTIYRQEEINEEYFEQ